MNALLAVRLLRRPKPVDGLRLLGKGLDDIIQRTTRELTLKQRLERYVSARHLCAPATPRQAQLADLRLAIGTVYRQAWRDGNYPRLAQFSRRFNANVVLAKIGSART